MAFILTVMGVVLVIEGIPYFAFPARAKQWAALMQDVPEKTLRIIGLLSMVFGLLVLAALRFIGAK